MTIDFSKAEPINPVVIRTDWPGFTVAIQSDTDFKAIWVAANTADPLVAQSLLVAFGSVATGGLSTFVPLFEAVCTLGNATPAQREAWATLAESFSAPAEFVDDIRG